MMLKGLSAVQPHKEDSYMSYNQEASGSIQYISNRQYPAILRELMTTSFHCLRRGITFAIYLKV